MAAAAKLKKKRNGYTKWQMQSITFIKKQQGKIKTVLIDQGVTI